MEPGARGRPRKPRHGAHEDPAQDRGGRQSGRRRPGVQRRAPALIVATTVLLSWQAGCAGRRVAPATTVDAGPSVGVYKGRVLDGDGRWRRFRLLLFAALPDRVHAEVLSPLGNPQLIVDGGNGRVAVTFVRDGESFVGAAGADVLGRVLGARLELGELVSVLLLGTGEPAGYAVERSGGEQPGLPDLLAISGPDAGLSLELKRRRPLGVDASGLGTGRPPPGTRVRPLEDLEGEDARLDALAGEATGP